MLCGDEKLREFTLLVILYEVKGCGEVYITQCVVWGCKVGEVYIAR